MGSITRRGVKFEFNDREIRAMLKGPEVSNALRSEAERMASRARATAPGDGGEYRASIHVEMDQTPTRARARVVADVEHATVIESRTGNLRRAAGG